MRVLFICTGNTCRSPMAAGLAGALHPDWEVRSAGLAVAQAGEPISPEAAHALRRRGLDAAEHRSTQVSRELVDWADRILVMTNAHLARLVRLYASAREKAALLTGEDLADPFMGSADDYERCAQAIEAAL